MWTISYRGFWIHGYCAKDECRVQGPNYSILRVCVSLRAAKEYIRRQR